MKENLRRHVETLAGVGSRYWRAPGFSRALEYTEDLLLSWGYNTRRQPFDVNCPRPVPCCNLIADHATWAGGPGAPEVIVGAHLDSVSPDAAAGGPAPGADDNASGCAVLLEAARIASESPPSVRIRFILFGAEEAGLHGSEAYVDALGADRSSLRAVWILDQVGLQTRDRPTLKLEGYKRWSGKLMDVAEEAAPDAGLVTVRTYRPYGSDHMPFLKARIPTLLLIQPDDEDDPLNHTAGDLPDRLDYDYMERILRWATLVLRLTPQP